MTSKNDIVLIDTSAWSKDVDGWVVGRFRPEAWYEISDCSRV